MTSSTVVTFLCLQLSVSANKALDIVHCLKFSPAEHFSSWFWFGCEVKEWEVAFCKWFIYLEPQGNGGQYNYPLCSACAWMIGSTIPRSVDRKKMIIGIASKVTRPVALGLLFLGPSKLLDILRKDMWPGPRAVLDQCNLHGSDKWHMEGNVTAVGDLLMCVHQTKWWARIKNVMKEHIFSMVSSKLVVL